MSNIFDYIEWRGDLKMTEAPINDVDMLILCRLSYVPLENAVPGQSETSCVTVLNAAKTVLGSLSTDTKKLRKKEDERLLEVLTDSPRFENIRLYRFIDILSEDIDEQFSAVTMLLDDDTVAVIFRGTDGTLVGWKEDFNMGFSPQTPAQRDALEYLGRTAKLFPDKKLRIAGHSKGGNLSLYASSFCDPEIQKRIISVRNFDGPGFNEHQSPDEGFSRLSDVTLSYLPESSIIGMLLEHREKVVIIRSQSAGLFQHNLYLWEIHRSGFITKDELNGSSYVIDSTLKDWLGSLSPEQRERMVDGVFQILQSSNGKTLHDLWNGKNALAVLSSAVKSDAETKQNISTGMKLLKKALKNNMTAKRAVDTMIDVQQPSTLS